MKKSASKKAFRRTLRAKKAKKKLTGNSPSKDQLKLNQKTAGNNLERNLERSKKKSKNQSKVRKQNRRTVARSGK